MNANAEEQELKDRLSLIETMIAEGRRGTESWGWVFLLWGVAYYVAILWSSTSFPGPIWGREFLAWPVTMTITFVLTLVIGTRKQGRGAATTIGRAIAAMWMAMGISMFTLLLSLGLSGRGEQQVFIAVIASMLGTTNAASSIILKWKMQFACAVVWWGAAVASLFANVPQSTMVFVVAIFFCQIVFGIYGMIAEARERKRSSAHA
jgi:hypothetical protein